MTPDAFIFWFLAVITVLSGLLVVTLANPIYSALALVMTMVGVAALFVTLGAYFIAGVQLIVYAGAVMVLFVMVLMLFDLKREVQAFTKGKISSVLKLMTIGVLGGLIIGAIKMSTVAESIKNPESPVTTDNTREIAQLLFTQYLFGFEALGVLLLVVAVGAVALSRSKGGTHAKS